MKSLLRQIHAILFLSGTVLFGNENGEATPEGLSDSDWSGIQEAYESNRHAITTDADGNYQARNPGQAWTTHFDGQGFTVTPDVGDWEWGLELEDYDEVREVLKEEGKLSYVRGDELVEWFINDRRGLEQGWTFLERPRNAKPGIPLRLSLSVRGGLSPEVSASGANTAFVDSAGNTVLNYGGLKAWDADGKSLNLRFVEGDEKTRSIVVEFNDQGARYPVTVDPVAQQAYVKASNSDPRDFFGYSVAVSGNTVVVGAWGEGSNATGVNGDQTDNSEIGIGAAYVFVRNGTSWSQEAYLKASIAGGSIFGRSVAISGDTIVIGSGGSHPVEVFVRSGSSWSQEALLEPSVVEGDWFGFSVAVSGDTVVVGAPRENGNATGINGDQTNNSAPGSGAAYVFVRNGTSWNQEAYLKASNTDEEDQFGHSVAVSGNTAVIGALKEDSSTKGINGEDADNSASESGAAYVFVRNGTSWSQEAYLKASNTDEEDEFGFSVAVSGDTIIVGAHQEDSGITGINGDDSDNSAPDSGAAYVFVRNETDWAQEAYLKASNTDAEDFFGVAVSISGDALLVGANGESSDATGVDGDQSRNFTSASGATYVFVRNGNSWNQEAYLKASNSNSGDLFGSSVALSGNIIVTGARNERSSADGINGDQFDNSSVLTGAAYFFNFSGIISLSISSQNGQVGGAGLYRYGVTTTLNAVPDPGYLFDGWSGDASGNDNPLTLTMDADKLVEALFVPDTSDVDGDGLSSYQELVIYGTDPNQVDSDGDSFPDGYELGIGRFSFVQDLLTWTQAKDAAVASGGHLATFTSQEEWDFALQSMGPTAFNGIVGAWIGATDSEEEGTWTWVTGEPFGFDRWADGQPENIGDSDFAEVSGTLGDSVGEWFDVGVGISREGYLLEIGYSTDPANADSDGDGLPDDLEISITLTNPTLSDSDNNGTSDGAEDSDNDGLSNVAEVVVHGSNPWKADSDDDGFDDLFELETGFDPLDGASTPDSVSRIMTAIEFSFNAADGVSYRIEASPDLINWQTIEEVIVGEGNRVDRFYSRRNQPMRHFRVRRN